METLWKFVLQLFYGSMLVSVVAAYIDLGCRRGFVSTLAWLYIALLAIFAFVALGTGLIERSSRDPRDRKWAVVTLPHWVRALIGYALALGWIFMAGPILEVGCLHKEVGEAALLVPVVCLIFVGTTHFASYMTRLLP